MFSKMKKMTTVCLLTWEEVDIEPNQKKKQFIH